MGDTYWYARDDYDATPSGPFHADPSDVAVGEGERLRPIDASVLPDDAEVGASEGDDVEPSLDEMGHDELKAEAERRGVADDIDLRSKASIRDALRDA
jgi:hypothetical protein